MVASINSFISNLELFCQSESCTDLADENASGKRKEVSYSIAISSAFQTFQSNQSGSEKNYTKTMIRSNFHSEKSCLQK